MSGIDLLDEGGPLDLRPRGRRTDPADLVARARRDAPLPEENDALRSWTERTPAAAAAPAPASACAACGKPARAACAQCGAGMCPTHGWSMLGLCKACAS